MKRGQSAIEFVGLISFMFVVFFAFFFTIQSQIVDTTQQRDRQVLASLSNIIVEELKLAQRSQPDFEHRFELPVIEKTYNVSSPDPYEIVVRSDGYEYVTFLPFNFTGYIKPPGEVQTVYRYDGMYWDDGAGEYDEHPNLRGIFMNIPAEECAEAELHSPPADCSELDAATVDDCRTYTDWC